MFALAGRIGYVFQQGGDLTQLFNAIGAVLKAVSTDFLSFLESLPVVGPIITFVNTIFVDVCTVIQKAIHFFVGSNNPDLNCQSARKRGLNGEGPLPSLPSEMTIPWHAPGGAAWCGTEMAAMNASGASFDTESDQGREFVVCIMSYTWLPSSAGGIADLVPGGGTAPIPAQHPCDVRMPALLTGTRAWPNWTLEEQTFAFSTCTLPRFAMEGVRLSTTSNTSWVPTDLIYNYGNRVPMLIGDMYYGYTVYDQYQTDRSTLPLTSVNDSAYASNWQAAGFSTAHLAAVAANATDPVTGVLNTTQVDVLFASDDASLGLTLQQYVARFVANNSASRPLDPVIIGGAAAFWRGLLGSGVPDDELTPAGAGNATGSWSLGTLAMNVITRLANQTVLDPPPASSITLTALSNRSPRTRAQFRATGMRAVLVSPWIVMARAVVGWQKANLSATGLGAVQSIGKAAVAATTLVQQWASGAAYDSALALDSYVGYAPPTTAWRLWPRVYGGLKNWYDTLQSEFGTMAQKLWRSGPQQLAAAAQELSARSTTAAARRAKLAALGDFVSKAALTEWYVYYYYYYYHDCGGQTLPAWQTACAGRSRPARPDSPPLRRAA